MTGDLADFLARLKTLLPAGWYPPGGETSGTAESPSPVLDALLAGPAEIDTIIYRLMLYAQAQTLIGTATDGILDIKVADYLGSALPRLLGETDALYEARALANLLPAGPTRAAMANALEAVLGQPARIVEPWSPADTGVLDGVQVSTLQWDEPGLGWDMPGDTWDENVQLLGAIYLDVDTIASPGRLTDPWMFPYQGFIEAPMLSAPLLGGAPVPCIDDGFYTDTAGSSMFDFPGTVPLGEQPILDAILKTKVEGTLIWVRFKGVIAAPAMGGPYLT